jgi:hypothetical protein
MVLRAARLQEGVACCAFFQAGCTQHQASLCLTCSRNLAMAELVVRLASPILEAAGYDPTTSIESRRAGDLVMFYVALHGRLVVARFMH